MPLSSLYSQNAIGLLCAASLALPATFYLLSGNRPGAVHVARSPLQSQLSKSSTRRGLYPSDALPGARDVETPYGAIRVHEWGPESGGKVLLIHGITTPCVALAGIAHGLVAEGRRVMLFDLFGRGYSDAPIGLPYSSALYTTQILIVLASSSIPWTGTKAFSIVGYSLGGGLAADFASYFPHLVASLVLIAPGGLLKKAHVTYKSKLLYSQSSILPTRLRDYLVGKRLYTRPATEATIEPGTSKDSPRGESSTINGVEGALHGGKFTVSPVLANEIVNWSIEAHPGFVPAFISSIQNAPIHEQHDRWREIECTCLLFLGRTDPIVIPDEVGPEVERVLGREKVQTVVLDGGHEIPMSHHKEMSVEIGKFLRSQK